MSNKFRIFLLLALWFMAPILLFGGPKLVEIIAHVDTFEDIIKISFILFAIPVFAWLSTIVFIFLPVTKILLISKNLIIYIVFFIVFVSPFSSKFALFDIFSIKSYIEILLNVLFPFISFVDGKVVDGRGLVIIFDLVLNITNISFTTLQVSFLYLMFVQIRTARAEGVWISDINFSESADKAWGIFSKPYEYFATAKAQFLSYIRDDEDLSFSNIGAQDMPDGQQSSHSENEAENDRDLDATEPGLSETDCLRLLGLEDGATPLEIKIAYRAVIATVHPDRNPDDPDASQKTAEIIAAFGTLQQAGRV